MLVLVCVMSVFECDTLLYSCIILQSLGLFDFVGGVPTSCNPSGQQWDFPNSWAPHQWYVVAGWFNSTNTDLRSAALSVAEKWINTTYTVWKAFNHSMFEKVSSLAFLTHMSEFSSYKSMPLLVTAL